MIERGEAIRIDAASRMEVVDALQMAAEVYATRCGLDEDGAHFISVALREALVNAIRHGGGNDHKRRVKVSLGIDGGGDLIFTIRDEGRGFDPSRVPDPRSKENLTRGNGRGIFYMRQFADAVLFRFPKRGGTLVILKKHLPSELAPPEAESGNEEDS